MCRACVATAPPIALTTASLAVHTRKNGVGRASPLILDNIGILIDAEKTNKAYAASIGKSADQLTIYEKKQALLNRILQEGADDLDHWNDMADTSADKMSRLAAETEEAKQQIGELAATIEGELAVAILDAGVTANQVVLLMEGGFLGASAPQLLPSWVCEFGQSQVAQFLGLPGAIGDWRPPSAFLFDSNAQTGQEITPADQLISTGERRLPCPPPTPAPAC